MMDNLYALQPLLVGYLLAQVPSLHFAAGVADAQSVRGNSKVVNAAPNPITTAGGLGTPKFGAVFVCPAPDFNAIEGASSTSEGGCRVTRQRWMLLVATINVTRLEQANNGEANPAVMANGLICAQVLPAMERFRWSPSGWPALKRLSMTRVPTGLPANIFPDENGLYLTAFAYETEQPQ